MTDQLDDMGIRVLRRGQPPAIEYGDGRLRVGGQFLPTDATDRMDVGIYDPTLSTSTSGIAMSLSGPINSGSTVPRPSAVRSRSATSALIL